MAYKVVLVAAARPNFMKIAPLIHSMRAHFPQMTPILVHTGQHYDPNMSQTFFDQLEIPKPDINLEIGKGTHAQQTGQTMIAFEQFLSEVCPDAVVVVGDVNATLACSLVAAKQGVLVAHVEAGLRSFDRTMPEEINRLATDAISDILYTPSPDASEQLRKEGVPEERIVFVGNIMIDTLFAQRERASALTVAQDLGLTARFGLVTLHRPSNVDHPETFTGIMEALSQISQELPLVFPVHPRTEKILNALDLDLSQIRRISPLGYLEMLNLTAQAQVVLTDSGGLQEETTALGVPCVTIRENTERPITITEGTNRLAGTSKIGVLTAYQAAQQPKKGRIPQFWDGQTARRINQHLFDTLQARGSRL